MTPTVEHAVKRWEGRGATHQFYDEMILETEEAFLFQVNPMTGKSYADQSLIDGRQRAWFRLARAYHQMKNAERNGENQQTQRQHLVALAAVRELRAKSQAALEAAVSKRQPTLEGELVTSIDHVTPLSERGPPCQRMSSRLGRGLRFQEIGKSDSITQHSSRSVNWDLMKGGGRT
jgi:hypothetical protein